MIYHVAHYIQHSSVFGNLFHYVTVRAVASLLTTLFCFCVFGNWFIETSKRLFRSKARESTPDRHRLKDDMPTMGGIFIVSLVLINCLVWCDLTSPHLWVLLLGMVLFAAIGAWDDWNKINRRSGISARAKFACQLSAALIVVVCAVYGAGVSTQIVVPFFKTMQPDIGVWYLVWATFIIVGCSNAVNLTDGLDGLAIGSLIPNFTTFALIAYLAGHVQFAHYLCIPYAATAEIAIAGATLVGASLGFLWFNAYPAQIFMGDVGSLALGAVLALMALMAKQELLLLIAGGLFVVETVSVIAQVWYFKSFKKRLFKMAPLHHHFELLGWPESKISVRFGIISLVLCLLAGITLKLR